LGEHIDSGTEKGEEGGGGEWGVVDIGWGVGGWILGGEKRVKHD